MFSSAPTLVITFIHTKSLINSPFELKFTTKCLLQSSSPVLLTTATIDHRDRVPSSQMIQAECPSLAISCTRNRTSRRGTHKPQQTPACIAQRSQHSRHSLCHHRQSLQLQLQLQLQYQRATATNQPAGQITKHHLPTLRRSIAVAQSTLLPTPS